MSTLKGKAHWHLCPWVLGGRIKKKKTVQKRSHGETGSQRFNIEMEEVREVVRRIRNVANNSASHTRAALLYLSFTDCPVSGTKMLEKSSSVNKVTDL